MLRLLALSGYFVENIIMMGVYLAIRHDLLLGDLPNENGWINHELFLQ